VNYLAHLALSGDQPEIITGNLMGDFLTRKQTLDKPALFQLGYELHMFIDQFTDTHEIVDEICMLFKKTHGKYTPVVVDIIFDYFLYENWSKFYPSNFHEFETSIYEILADQKTRLPEKTSLHIGRLVEGKFLNTYKSLEGLSYVLKRMDVRAQFPSRFINAIEIIEKDNEVITEKFLSFYMELKKSTDLRLDELKSEMM
jgi:acyl carrier protein phosphodiesterase